MSWTSCGINHVHFYLDALAPLQTSLVEQWGFRSRHTCVTPTTRTVWLVQGGVWVALSEALTAASPVALWRDRYAEGIADVAIAIDGLDDYPYGEWVGSKRKVLQTPFGIQHSLVQASPAPARHGYTHIDHAVLNVSAGDLALACDWYHQYLGLSSAETFCIQTPASGLQSVVMRSASGLQIPINAPLTPNSQIQDFLDRHGGAGIQHVALHSNTMIETVQHLRSRGVAFIPIPAQYYDAIAQPELAALEILVDPIPPRDRYLLQTFTQPILSQPTFFWEIIQRVNNRSGFGEGNFQALYEAVEREQQSRASAESR